jgi:predicted patatin/cPLA2 family phospholipase
MLKKSTKILKKKRALVCDGGGLAGAFVAGILAGFYKNGIKADFFDYLIGTSAGAFNISYYTTGQMEEGMRIWNKHLPNKLFKLRGIKPVLDLPYVEKIITKLEPLNTDYFKSAKPQIFITLSNPKTLKPRFVHLNRKKNPISVLLATSAMPFFSGPKKVDGKKYYDGGLTSQPSVDFVKKLKVDEVWVLMVDPKGYRFSKTAHKIASWVMGKNLAEKKLIANRPHLENSIFEDIEKNGNYYVIRPKKQLPVTWLRGGVNEMKKTIAMGELAAKKFLLKYEHTNGR